MRLQQLNFFQIFIFGFSIALLCVSGPRCAAQSEIFDVSHDQVSLIRPGTKVSDGVPKGWTHLVLKSKPDVTRGDVSRISKTDKKMSSMVRTATLANVVKRRVGDRDVYQLSQVSLGLCLKIRGVDTVASPDTQSKLGGGLGFIARTVFSTIYSEQKKVHYVCRSDYSVIYDAPMIIRHNGKNDEHVCRYAILVNPDTGHLNSLVWLIQTNRSGRYETVSGKAQSLAKSHIYKCDLHVDANEYTFGLPSKRAFACVAIPEGDKSFKIPREIRSLASKQKLTSADSRELVSGLRKELAALERSADNESVKNRKE